MNDWCAICASDVGPFTREPLGRNNAVVNVCADCVELDARHYAFDDSSKCRNQPSGPTRRVGAKGMR
jgi:hypothetical protein